MPIHVYCRQILIYIMSIVLSPLQNSQIATILFLSNLVYGLLLDFQTIYSC